MEITEEQKERFKRGFIIGFFSFLGIKILHKFFKKYQLMLQYIRNLSIDIR
ncbi:MAG: hypothetical protein LBF71_02065 [Campylobacteraceae bacterium]|jgi:hypothetical protein|nr:hypothetical protein [Campylobacteraceae bacterium]